MDVDRNTFGCRDHFIGSLRHGPGTNVDKVIALEFTNTNADLLELVFLKWEMMLFVQLFYPPIHHLLFQ